MELYVRDQDGSGEPRQLTTGSSVWRYPAVWSPDGKRLAFGDSDATLRVLEVDSGKISEVDRGRRGDIDSYVWAPDSRWLAYETTHPETDLPCIAAWSIDDDYTPQALYQRGGEDWDTYYQQACKYLLRQQRKDGSWQGDGVGTVYGTAIALTILQLPYAYAPIYQR